MERNKKKRPAGAFPGRPLGPLARRLWPLTHYLVTNLTVTLFFVLFHVLNRTKVVGRENVPREPNTLLLSNHQTLIDSFLVGLCVYYPASLVRPSLIPWNPAAEENYYRSRLLAWLADNWKCIPIKKGRKDVGAFRRMTLGLRTSPLVLFPEGTRSRDGSIGKAREGPGFLVLLARPTVVPVCIDGMDQVLPVGARFPRFSRRITVRYGKPLDLSSFYGRKKSKETSQAVMDRVMDAIRALRRDIHEQHGLAPGPAAHPRAREKAAESRRASSSG